MQVLKYKGATIKKLRGQYKLDNIGIGKVISDKEVGNDSENDD